MGKADNLMFLAISLITFLYQMIYKIIILKISALFHKHLEKSL